MNFSTRQGFELKQLQMDSIDEELRNRLWTLHHNCFEELISDAHRRDVVHKFFLSSWTNFFKKAVHIFPSETRARLRALTTEFYKLRWYKVYSFLEYVAAEYGIFFQNYKEQCNLILKEEKSAWHFMGNIIVPIMSIPEKNEIELVLAEKDEAAKHLQRALELLSEKEVDCSRESAHQSISAVEAIAKKAMNDPSASLSKLCASPNFLPKHSQFRQALFNLFNYTSGEDGIRHSLTDKSQPVTDKTARFMLIICSAFINLIRDDYKSREI